MNTNQTRADFMRHLSVLEGDLVDFNHNYPISFGEMFRRHLGIMLMVLALFIGIQGAEGAKEQTQNFYGVLACIPVVGFMVFIKRFKLDIPHADPALLTSHIEEMEQKYGEFPDVKEYLADFRKRADAAIKKKKRIKVAFTVTSIGLAIVCAVVINILQPELMLRHTLWFVMIGLVIWGVIAALNAPPKENSDNE